MSLSEDICPRPNITYVPPLTPQHLQPNGDHENQDSEGFYDGSDYSDNYDDFDEEDEDQGDALDHVNNLGWEDGAGDFTKHYNRARQFVVASTSQNSSKTTPLPAMNRISRQAITKAPPEGDIESTKGKTPMHGSKIESSLQSLQARFSSSIDLSPTNFGATRKGGSEKVSTKDRKDRATTEQVLDARTRLVLFKMMGRGLISRIEGCVSTGKEANVYHAIRGDLTSGNQGHMAAHAQNASDVPLRLALKVFKTSILIFKDRDRYVTGEYRFRGGYARSNPRKMVRLWAEKELRNLRRLRAANLPSPEPIEVRNNVLVMEFLGQGEDTWEPSPRLKDASIRVEQIPSLYTEMLTILRVLFWQCHLVHADLSEYNILYHNSHLYVIDVSQSVEHDHPRAFDFLRSDIQNVEDFFKRRQIRTLGLRRTFDYVVSEWTGKDEPVQWEEALKIVESDLRRIRSEYESADSNTQEQNNEKEQDDAVFHHSFLPRTLYDLSDAVERGDLGRFEGKDKDMLKYTGIAENSGIEQRSSEDSSEDDNDEDEQTSEFKGSSSHDGTLSDENAGETIKKDRPKGKKHESRQEKKERRTAAKEAKREKRKHKIPKSIKKRQVNKTSGKK